MANESVIRVLQVVPNMQAGGLENSVMNYYRNIDRNKVQYDFIVHYKTPKFYDDEIKKMGGHIYYLSFRDDKNIFKYIKDLYSIYKTKKYSIVHSHMASLAFIHLGMAKLCGIPIRIIHSRNASTGNDLKGFIKSLLLKLAPLFANRFFACGQNAGKFLFRNHDFLVVNNAADLGRFYFSPTKRTSVRQEFSIKDDSLVIGHIGRFNIQKNHLFLLDVFFEVLKLQQNAVLVLLGEGENRDQIVKKIQSLGIDKNVILAGVRKDVDRFYCGFDMFCLPSFFEGLPNVGVEAQASGCPCLFSTEVTQEVNLLPTTEYLSLNETPQKWAEKIIEMSKINRILETKKYMLKYDISHEAKKMEEWYLQSCFDERKYVKC